MEPQSIIKQHPIKGKFKLQWKNQPQVMLE